MTVAHVLNQYYEVCSPRRVKPNHEDKQTTLLTTTHSSLIRSHREARKQHDNAILTSQSRVQRTMFIFYLVSATCCCHPSPVEQRGAVYICSTSMIPGSKLQTRLVLNIEATAHLGHKACWYTLAVSSVQSPQTPDPGHPLSQPSLPIASAISISMHLRVRWLVADSRGSRRPLNDAIILDHSHLPWQIRPSSHQCG